MDYRGLIGILLINFGIENFLISNGDRIAQMVITKHETVDLVPRLELDTTIRGADGYGSTGIK